MNSSSRDRQTVVPSSYWTLMCHTAVHSVRAPLLATLFTVLIVEHVFLFPFILPFYRGALGSAYADESSTVMSGLRYLLSERLVLHETSLEDCLLWVGVTMVIHSVMYVAINVFYALCDCDVLSSSSRKNNWLSWITRLLSFLQRWAGAYKIERPIHAVTCRPAFDTAMLLETIVGHIFVQPVFLVLIFTFVARFRRFDEPILAAKADHLSPLLISDFQHWSTIFVQFFWMQVVQDAGFYITHRAFHEFPALYQHHKLHHSFRATVSWAAEVQSPLEQINIFDQSAYCIIFSPSISLSVWCGWIVWRLWEAYEVHSGFDFSQSWLGKMGLLYGERARFHDLHHSRNTGNYGNPHLFDYIFGTYISGADCAKAAKKD